MFSHFNERLALRLTGTVGTMWCAYVFLIWTLIPLVFPTAENAVQYISQSILQLVLLSVIMVGQDVTSRKAEKRAREDHHRIKEELKELRAMHAEAMEQHVKLAEQNVMLIQMVKTLNK